MRKLRFLICILILFTHAFLSHAQQLGLYPLSHYSAGAESNMQFRTTAVVQDDTLKLPYIEDFSGFGLPIDTITVDTFSKAPTLVLVYRITQLKMHGLKTGDSIRVYNSIGGNPLIPANIWTDGIKIVNVINKYAFQIFNDKSFETPAKVIESRITYLNWLRVGANGYSTIPDSLGFVANNGGVYINNDMALNPISIGVASFDGVNYTGVPYSTGTGKGYGDNLTSLPFDLSKYNPKDSIYMSFYWQSTSLGDTPLSSEFLSLEFKDTSKTDTWIQVWKRNGNPANLDTFLIAMVAIDSAYFHKGFQYRFRSYGALNGRFNVWNLDYIYINTKRKKLEPFLKDVSIISTNRSALKNYTSVPYKHIRGLSVSAIRSETDTAFVKIRDNYTGPGIPIERNHLIRDNVYPSDDTIWFVQTKDPLLIQDPIFTQKYTDTIPGGLMTAPYVLKEEFYYQALDTVGPIDMTFNNFAAIETYFYDYYSYDDNVPERAFLSVNAGGIKIANEFKILNAGLLTHMDYCFIKNNGPDMTNTPIFLNVWKNEPAINNSNTLRNQQIAIKYSSTINGFVRYELTTPLPLDSGATYYFGYTQKSNNALFLGYDRNNNHLDKIFYCFDGINWHPFTDFNSETGSLMIRPVFGTNEIITRVEDKESKQTQFSFFPNPAKDALHLTGQPDYISVYDLSGQLLLEKKIEDTEVLSTAALTDGLYLVILSKGDYKEVKRLIIQK